MKYVVGGLAVPLVPFAIIAGVFALTVACAIAALLEEPPNSQSMKMKSGDMSGW